MTPRITGFLLSTFFICFSFPLLLAQPISGVVLDVDTNQPIPYVQIGVKHKKIGVLTNEEGKFILNSPIDLKKDTLVFFFLGYKKIDFPLHLID